MTTFLRDAFTKFHRLAKEEREGGTVQSPSVRPSFLPSFRPAKVLPLQFYTASVVFVSKNRNCGGDGDGDGAGKVGRFERRTKFSASNRRFAD